MRVWMVLRHRLKEVYKRTCKLNSMEKVDIAVIDYGMGNLRSVSKALEHVAPSQSVYVTSDPDVVKRATRVVFPGQGAMPDCIRELDERGLREAVVNASQQKPFLGICIGMQMLFETSEEGGVDGLGLFKGRVKRFAPNLKDANGVKLKVPHMGWSQVNQVIDHPLWHQIENGERFYYVHSYYVSPEEPALIAGQTDYPDTFTGAIARENLFAVQFHPEKSAQAGLQLLSNFVNWNP